MRVFKVKWFVRFARREKIADEALIEAITRVQNGNIDGDLGGGIIKQRVARPGKGRSAGYRTLIAYRRGERAIFLYGFAKSDRENIDEAELDVLRIIGTRWLAESDAEMERRIAEGEVKEVGYDEGDEAGS